MFTGIIEELGVIRSINRSGGGLILRVEAPDSAPRLVKGGSISINGACQSATALGDNWFEVLATAETVKKTCFANFKSITIFHLIKGYIIFLFTMLNCVL